MHGRIDITYITVQQDLYRSGLAAELGSDAINVWLAIKCHADFNNGLARPTVRCLMRLTRLASATVQKALVRLEDAHLLKIQQRGAQRRANRYIARERLDVASEQGAVCRIVIDYVPMPLSKWLKRIKAALEVGENDPEAFSKAEFFPPEGFVWDSKSGDLRAIPRAVTSPQAAGPPVDKPLSPLAARVAEIGRFAIRNSENVVGGPPRCANTKTGLTVTHLPRGESWLESSVPVTCASP